MSIDASGVRAVLHRLATADQVDPLHERGRKDIGELAREDSGNRHAVHDIQDSRFGAADVEHSVRTERVGGEPGLGKSDLRECQRISAWESLEIFA